MTRKYYQWLAIAVLVLAPLLTGVLDDYLPGRERADAIDLGTPPPPPAPEPVAVIRTDLSPAQTTTQQAIATPSDGAAMSASPTLDTSGMAVGGAEIAGSDGAAPVQPVGSVPAPALALPQSAVPPMPTNRVPAFREGPINP